MIRLLRKYGLYAVWVLAMVGMLGSLYASDVLYMKPCSLCWYQRICLYPLTIIAGRAAWLGFIGIAGYIMPLTWIGMFIAFYHVWLQRFLHTSWLFAEPSCAVKTTLFGFFTLPILSAILFVLINALLFPLWRLSKKEVS
ncbi:MAG: disulfide bond formation protein B [Verrucomicrobiota bacterium]|nr:disulfide bond formation protein B [Verrucomicrobiota bacterium]